jgi:lipopolysaccharide transport system ATP-binding protein
MSETAVSLSGVIKSFRRFQRPGWRALDALGLPISPKRYDTFYALRGLDLEIRRGEKVALIGRNGAGKSTLLRVISGQIRADAGQVSVHGTVQALMELGTGFHPDFTGVDNIRSALAYQGIPSHKTGRVVDEIIDFTELEEFINRPVREYSAGMYARLAFAVATTITPEILIIDEILGAGDAYFVGKCIQRMKDLTTQGATIVFVSHDMSAVQLLCDRGVWIDKGLIKADTDILSVSKAYLASVRDDEEVRAMAKSMSLTRGQVADMQGRRFVSLFRLIGVDGGAPSDSFAVGEIRFGGGAKAIGNITPADNDTTSRVIVDPLFMNWKHAVESDGRPLWHFGDFGGRYVHAPWQIDWLKPGQHDSWLEIEYRASTSHAVAVEQYDEKQKTYVRLIEIPKATSKPTWQTVRIRVRGEAPSPDRSSVPEPLDLQVLAPEDRYGTGQVKITAFGFFDETNTQRYTLISGERASAVIAYSADEAVLNPVTVIAIYRFDGTCAMQVISNRNGKQLGTLVGRGTIRFLFNPLLLGPGDYITSVALFKYLNLASRHEPDAYDLHDRCYTLKVLPPVGIGVEIGMVNQPMTWELSQ